MMLLLLNASVWWSSLPEVQTGGGGGGGGGEDPAGKPSCLTWSYEFNTLTWAILIVVTSVLLKKVGQLLRLWVMGSCLPGPGLQALVARSVIRAKADGPLKLLELFSSLHKQHGSVLKIWMGPTQLLVSILDVRIVNELLEKAHDRVPAPRMALQLAFGKGSLFFAPFSKVEGRRTIYDREFNGKNLGQVHAIALKVIQKLGLWATLDQDGNWQTDSKSFSQSIAFAVLGISIFGEGYVEWAAAREFEKLLISIADEISVWVRYTVPPVWRPSFIHFWRKCNRLKHLTRNLVAEAHKNLQTTVCAIDNTKDNTAHNDDATPETQSGGATLDGKDNCKVEVFEIVETLKSNLVTGKILGDGRASGMMYHGGCTTAGILSGILTQLAHHPDIQAKVYAEIKEVCGSNLAPSQSDVKQLHYLMASLHESARLLPTAPFLQRCSLQSDFQLAPGLIVPAGAIMAAPVHLLHLNPVCWGNDSADFNPERFLKPKSEFCLNVKANSSHTHNELNQTQKDTNMSEKRVFQAPPLDSGFLLFGTGARSCIGANFALTEILSLVAALVQGYELKLAPGSPKDLTPKLENGVLQYSPSARLILIPRSTQI